MSTMKGISQQLLHFLTLLYYWIEGIILFFVPTKYKSKDIKGELVLITGAGSGIGRLMALKFADKGANLVLWDINTKGNEETAALARAKGVKAHTYSLDVTDSEAVYQTAAKVKDDAGTVTILVNNAGIVIGKSILDLDDKMVQKIFEVNAISHFWAELSAIGHTKDWAADSKTPVNMFSDSLSSIQTLKAFLPDMLEKDHGHIVSIASLAGIGGIPQLTDYCSTKFAAIGLMDSLAVELHAQGRKNIKTTTICPFFINTGMFTGAGSSLFKTLEPEYVADQVLEAVLCNKVLVFIPRVFYFLHTVKTIIPSRALLALQDLCGGSNAMAGFTGRKSKKIN